MIQSVAANAPRRLPQYTSTWKCKISSTQPTLSGRFTHRKIFRFNHTCRNFTRFLISSFPKLIKAHAKSSLYSIICFESACVKLGGLGGTVSFRVGKFSEVFLARFN